MAVTSRPSLCQRRHRFVSQHPFVAAGGVALDANTLETNIIHFKLDVDEWKDNEKKVRLALILLPKWVDPAIRGKVQEYENPKEAWEYLKGQYKMTNLPRNSQKIQSRAQGHCVDNRNPSIPASCHDNHLVKACLVKSNEKKS